MNKPKYVVQYKSAKTGKRWVSAVCWMYGQKPGTEKAANNAMAKAQKHYPLTEYRVVVFKENK